MPSLLDHKLVRKVREMGASRLLQRIHRITHRLPLTLHKLERTEILVVAPHMDDEVIGPGGTMALHRRLGSRIDVVFCCAGATPEADAVRKREARAVAAFLEFNDLRFLDHPEGQLSRHENKLGDDLARVIGEIQPKQIFCPYPADHHRDHSAAAMGVLRGIEQARWDGEIWTYEVWSPLWPNVAVDISDVVDIKRTVIAMHESQVAGLHYVDGALGLNRYRALRVYVPYAETFYVGGPREYRNIAEQMNTL